MVGEPPDIIPGKKFSIWPPLVIAATIAGLTWVLYGLLGYNFAFGLQLFAVSMATVLVVPPLLARFGVGQKYPIVVAIVEAAIIVFFTSVILVFQGIWITSSGKFEIQVLITGAAITMMVASVVVAYIALRWDITL